MSLDVNTVMSLGLQTFSFTELLVMIKAMEVLLCMV